MQLQNETFARRVNFREIWLKRAFSKCVFFLSTQAISENEFLVSIKYVYVFLSISILRFGFFFEIRENVGFNTLQKGNGWGWGWKISFAKRRHWLLTLRRPSQPLNCTVVLKDRSQSVILETLFARNEYINIIQIS